MFKKNNLVFLVALLLTGVSCVVAGSVSESRFLQITSGKYRFRLQVLGMSSKIEVQNATAAIQISNNSASIEVIASGYRPQNRCFELEEGVYYYESRIFLPEPTTFTFLRDQTLKQIEDGLSYPEWEPCNNYWYDEICVAGEFPKTGFENLSINDFHVHINWTHDYAWAPRVFIFDREDKWGFEIMVDRTALKPNKANHIDLIITRNGFQSEPRNDYLQYLASKYKTGLYKLGKADAEADFQRQQERLESTAAELTRNIADLSLEEQKEILAQLPDKGPLTRDLNRIVTFRSLHD